MKQINIFFVQLGRKTPSYPLITPPLGIMYLASYIRSKFNVKIRLVNQKADNISNDELIKEIIAFESSIICISLLTPASYNLPYLTKNIKSSLPGSLVIIGGPHVSSFESKSLIGNEADIAVPDEGEIALEKIIERYLSGEGYDDVASIYLRDRGKRIYKTAGEVQRIENIDSLPFPAYDLINPEVYWKGYSMPNLPKRKYVSLFSSRGCPYQCTYCHHIFGKKYRVHSAERIIDEIVFLKNKYRIEDIEFLDDIFNLDKKRMSQFCNLIHKKNIKLKILFPNGVRTDILTGDEIKALKDAGLFYASYALESGSPRIQKLIGKNLNIEKYFEITEISVKNKIFTNAFVMLGFPTETAEEMMQTINLVCNSRLHLAVFFNLTPFPGTKIYELIKSYAPEKLKLINYNDFDYTRVYSNFSAETDEKFFYYQRLANRKFFINPYRLFSILRYYNQRYMLPLYIPKILYRFTKGLFIKDYSDTFNTSDWI